jgi:hypothetical protein
MAAEIHDFRIDQLVVFIDGEDPMSRKAFNREWPGNTDFLVVFAGSVVEVFGIGFGRDGGVDFLLAGNALFPPLRVCGFRFF